MHRIWIAVFVIWAIFLSGFLEFWMKTPGLKQWAEVRQMIRARNQEIAFVEEESARLKATELSLENSPAAQEREIRKVLGFVDQNEIVFEFDK